MAGFKLNIKKNGPIRRKNAFGGPINDPRSQKNKGKSVFGDSDSDQDDDKIIIDSFDHKKGAMAKESAVSKVNKKKKKKVIMPENLSKVLPRNKSKEKNKSGGDRRISASSPKAEPVSTNGTSGASLVTESGKNITRDEAARKSLMSHENQASNDFTIPNTTTNSDESGGDDDFDYEDVPVEDFGAALMRGMGWKPKETEIKDESKIIEKRKKGVLLGIGAKAVEDEIMEELMAKSRTRYEIPLVKKPKST